MQDIETLTEKAIKPAIQLAIYKTYGIGKNMTGKSNSKDLDLNDFLDMGGSSSLVPPKELEIVYGGMRLSEVAEGYQQRIRIALNEKLKEFLVDSLGEATKSLVEGGIEKVAKGSIVTALAANNPLILAGAISAFVFKDDLKPHLAAKATGWMKKVAADRLPS